MYTYIHTYIHIYTPYRLTTMLILKRECIVGCTHSDL